MEIIGTGILLAIGLAIGAVILWLILEVIVVLFCLVAAFFE